MGEPGLALGIEDRAVPPGEGANRTVADVIAASLARHGVEVVFGQSIPTQLYLATPEHHIRQLTIRTEKAGAMMADGYARISRKVAVVTSIAGPGAALLVPGLGEALKASIPVVALIQDTPRAHMDRNHAQDIDHVELLRAVTKLVRRVERADRVEDYIDLAFTMAASGRPGPVALLFPGDLFDEPAAAAGGRVATLGAYPLDRTQADPARVAEAAALLAEAESPILVAGGGVHVSGAHEELSQLQDLACLPVATTMMGKGAVDEGGALSLGVIGYAMGRRAPARAHGAMIQRADVVLLVGNRTNQNGTDSWRLFAQDARFIHLDIDGGEVGRNYEALRLVGDAKRTRFRSPASTGAAAPAPASRPRSPTGAMRPPPPSPPSPPPMPARSGRNA
jgi:acetolactate synthase-1/2/3 large subunit